VRWIGGAGASSVSPQLGSHRAPPQHDQLQQQQRPLPQQQRMPIYNPVLETQQQGAGIPPQPSAATAQSPPRVPFFARPNQLAPPASPLPAGFDADEAAAAHRHVPVSFRSNSHWLGPMGARPMQAAVVPAPAVHRAFMQPAALQHRPAGPPGLRVHNPDSVPPQVSEQSLDEAGHLSAGQAAEPVSWFSTIVAQVRGTTHVSGRGADAAAPAEGHVPFQRQPLTERVAMNQGAGIFPPGSTIPHPEQPHQEPWPHSQGLPQQQGPSSHAITASESAGMPSSGWGLATAAHVFLILPTKLCPMTPCTPLLTGSGADRLPMQSAAQGTAEAINPLMAALNRRAAELIREQGKAGFNNSCSYVRDFRTLQTLVIHSQSSKESDC
jgi:hypothetical protein